ncbi:MAG: hypothetical protein ACC726_07505 [Chloroflexota bacterium]
MSNGASALATPSTAAETSSPGTAPETRLRTEFAFVLPRGYVDESGNVHRNGVMRLATAKDEIIPQRDPRVRDNESYLSVLLLSRVITRLGSIAAITPGVIENMFASDLAFLQDLYRRINQDGSTELSVTCPSCRAEVSVDLGAERLGES